MTLRFAAPATLDALAALLADTPAPWLIAGGTDRLIAPAALPDSGMIVDLGRLAEMQGISAGAGRLHIGAATTVAELARDARVARLAPVLTQAAAAFGSVQIRNRATIGGNVAHGAAAADLLPALMATGAGLRLWRPGGGASLALSAFLARRPRLAGDEIILGLDIAAGPAPRGAFVKLGSRQEPVIARLTLAAAGTPGQMRLYAGALGPQPLHLAEAEALLNAGDPGFARAVARAVSAANPGRASTAWKARAVEGLAFDLLDRLETAA